MSQLTDLLLKVKDENLPLNMVEKYRDELVHLHSAMQLEMADLEKKEAQFFLTYREGVDAGLWGPDKKQPSDIEVKRKWRGTSEGQRLIELNRYVKAVSKEVDSLKSRVYRLL